MAQFDIADDLILFIGQLDLYFMVHWFWHIPNTINSINIILGNVGKYDTINDFI